MRNAADNSLFWQAASMSASGQVLTENLGNLLSTTRTYDALDRLTQVTAGGSGTNVQNSTYQYDPVGNLSQRVEVVQSNLTENCQATPRFPS